ncbi:MAG: SBBP repeat-containing protein [Acidobacteriia bacterium]|nr:SBBP repeat-containing protein [Terriglobia bacterium]
MKKLVFPCIFLVCFLGLNPYSFSAGNNPSIHPQKIIETLRGLPLVFEPNAGQAEKEVRFVVHGPEAGASFTSRAVELWLPGGHGQTDRLRMELHGNPNAEISGEDQLPGRTNYLRGTDRSQWRTGIANFARIRYAHLYPGIDLAFYGNGENLEHDFIVAPGAKPERIQFDLKGAQRLEVDNAGDLVVHLAGGILKFKRPYAYQQSPSGRTPVAAQFRLRGSQIAFKLGRYDRSRALTIDPVLSFSTFLAGSRFDRIFGMATDSSGNIYVTGDTNSPDFPTAVPLQPTCSRCTIFPNRTDAFVAKLNSTGTALIYSTFLGGGLRDLGFSIAVDSSGNAIVAGNTTSPDFPAVNPIGSASCCSNEYLFVSSLSPTGASLNYSGIVGPLRQAVGFGAIEIPQSTFPLVTVDTSGNAYVTSQTLVSSFPTTPGTLAAVPASSQSATLVAAKIDPTGGLTWSTAILGNATPGPSPGAGAPPPNTFFPRSISVDAGGNLIITGGGTTGLPTTAGVVGPVYAPDTTAPGATQGFALKLNPTASALSYATYLPATDSARAAAIDTLGNAYIGGVTSSPSLPVSATALFKTQGCTSCQTGYLLKLNATATTIPSATYWAAEVDHLLLDSGANVYVTGTGSVSGIASPPVVPETNPMFTNGTGFTSVSELSSDFSGLLFSTILSPPFSNSPSLAVTSSGKIILGGNNQGFPGTPGSFQSSLPPGAIQSGQNPMISAIDPAAAGPGVCQLPASIVFNTAGLINATLQNCGNGDLHITSITSGSSLFTVNSNCPVALIPAASCTVSVTFSPLDGSFQTGTIVIKDDAPATQQVIQVKGPGVGSPLDAIPSLVSFFDTLVGSSLLKKDAVSAINGSSQNMVISNVAATGDFHVPPNACPFTLPPPGPFISGECDIDVSFSPTAAGLRTGTLSFVDSVSGSTHTVQLRGNGVTTQPAPVPIGTTYPASGGPPLLLLGNNFTANSVVTVDGLVRSSQFLSPTALDLSHSSITLSDFSNIGELPASVTTPAPGGGTSNTQITAYAAATTTSFDNLTFPVAANQLVYDPNTGLIYATLKRSQLVDAVFSDVLAVDPVTRKAVKGFALGHPVTNALAISDDGQFLYVGFDDLNSVAQITASTGHVNFVAPLGSDPDFGPYVANAIRVLPGQPHSWVVSLAAANPAAIFSPLGVKVFDDATARPTAVLNGYSLGVFPGALTFVGSNTTTLYSADTSRADNSLYRFTIGPAGITLQDKTPGLGWAELDSDGVSLYLSNGNILDPVTLASKGSFTLAPGILPRRVKVDAAASRVFFIGDSPRIEAPPGFAGGSIQAFNLATLAPVGSLEVPEISIDYLVRWGTNGLAFMDTKDASSDFPSELELTRSHLTGTPAIIAAFRIGSGPNADTISAVTVKGGSPATFNLTAIATNGFTGQITFSCSSLPLFAACSFSPSSITVGPGSASMTVTVATTQPRAAIRKPAGGSLILLATVLGAPLAIVLASRRRKLMAIACLSLMLALVVVGCGGGGGSTTPPPAFTTPPGSYSIVVTGTGAGATRSAALPLVVQ